MQLLYLKKFILSQYHFICSIINENQNIFPFGNALIIAIYFSGTGEIDYSMVSDNWWEEEEIRLLNLPFLCLSYWKALFSFRVHRIMCQPLTEGVLACSGLHDGFPKNCFHLNEIKTASTYWALTTCTIANILYKWPTLILITTVIFSVINTEGTTVDKEIEF